MTTKEAIEKINNGELNCPKCQSDIIQVLPQGRKIKLVCRWCGSQWKVPV